MKRGHWDFLRFRDISILIQKPNLEHFGTVLRISEVVIDLIRRVASRFGSGAKEFKPIQINYFFL